MLNYQTDLDIANVRSLRTEVDDIWTQFRYDAERGNFNSAVISAHNEPKGVIFKSGQTHNFAFTRGPDGQWHLLSK